MFSTGKENFIICGQALTGRLEVLEAFFKKRFKEVCIIGISSIYAAYNAARLTVYSHNKCYERKLFNLTIHRSCRLKGLFFSLAYCIYFINVFFSILFVPFAKNRSVFIGIGCFPAMMGIIFKKIKLVEKVIYYNIDYFPPTNKAFLVKIFIFLDKFCVGRSDLVWLISHGIIDAREKFARITSRQYKHATVPLTFDESLLKWKEAGSVERWSVVFVGTSGYFHGLQLLIDAMPRLIKAIPRIKIKLIGPGPWEDIKKNIERLNLLEYFQFLGFIEEEARLFEIVSGCALGLALYVPIENNPTFYADPGKPKLYAFCAVPIVISKTPAISQEIDFCGAGKAIDFNTDSLISAMVEILTDDFKWNEFRKASFNFAKRYTSKEILEPAIKDLCEILN